MQALTPCEVGLILGALVLYCVYFASSQVITICSRQSKDLLNNMTHKYDILLVKMDLLQRKLINMQKEQDLRQLKKKNEEMATDIAFMRTTMKELQLVVTSTVTANNRMAAFNGCPPPPPPPPPNFLSVVTPASKMSSAVSNNETASKKKKGPGGPPQMNLSEADLTDMLKKLKKTSNKSKLLGNEDKVIKKTPPRKNLFSRFSSPGSGRCRTFTINVSSTPATGNRSSKTVPPIILTCTKIRKSPITRKMKTPGSYESVQTGKSDDK